MILFRPAVFRLIIVITENVLSGCTSDSRVTNMNLDNIAGKTMEEVIAMEGAPARRAPDQLIYKYDARERVTPVWAYLLLVGMGGSGAGESRLPGLEYYSRDHYCVTLEFKDNILVNHAIANRDPNDSC